MGSQVYENVEVPMLWGVRAVIQDQKGRISVIDLSGDKARLEILGDVPAPEVEFRPRVDGFVILQHGRELYGYDPTQKLLTSIALGLPEVQISENLTRVGTNQFSRNRVSGHGVGIAVDPESISVGAPIPKGLAKLVI
jgi:hypothetical protein